MPKGPIRRAQLIAPFGSGAMVVVRDGTSLIAGGLDHWFEPDAGNIDGVAPDLEEYRLEEWRLQRLLKVNHFRQPPDFRDKRLGEIIPNCYLTIPFLSFPQWRFCPACNRLYRLPLTIRQKAKCEECEAKGKFRYLIQVPFVAMCDAGHLQDFPWAEWVHGSINPDCKEPMRLIATGGVSLAAQKIKCDCGKAERTLAQITNADSTDGSSTYLTDNLDRQKRPFFCQGKRPWLGSEEGEPCRRPLKGSLRNASNVYFAQVRSAIYIPRGNNSVPSELIALFEKPPLSTLVEIFSGLGQKIEPEVLRGQHGALLQRFSNQEINGALGIIKSGREGLDEDTSGGTNDDQHTAFRRTEFDVLKNPKTDEQLLIRQTDLKAYRPEVSKYISKIMLIDKLRETRALAGFTRILPDNQQTPEQRKMLLWRTVPGGKGDWLPAYKVFGEGIFLEINEEKLRKWESQDKVKNRVNKLKLRYQNLQKSRHLKDQNITPRFILLHTLGHLIMNRLTFECGYSSASLRERLYVSENFDKPMAALLIYTAAGDAEGTLGGLVRMGKAGNFEPVIQRAFEEARWCSADPVCMEAGESGGQGPDSCNLAACHGCALMPETACEQFNRFLDRGLVVGHIKDPQLGFFNN